MRKMILAVAMVLLLCGGATAQTTFDLGLKVGGGMAKVNISGVDFKFGLDGGAFFGITPWPNTTIQTELLYAQKGMKVDIAGVAEYKWKLDYIEVPILLKRTFPTQGSLKPYLTVGPVIGFLTSAKEVESIPLLGLEEEEDIKDAFKSTDIAIAVGGGLDYLVGTNGMLLLDLRFSISLTDNFEDKEKVEGAIIEGDESLRNWNITFMVGYGFELGGASGI